MVMPWNTTSLLEARLRLVEALLGDPPQMGGLGNFVRPRFSARARKTAPGAGALLFYFGVRVKPVVHFLEMKVERAEGFSSIFVEMSFHFLAPSERAISRTLG